MERFKIEQLDQNKFVKANDSTKEITNSALFNAGNGPTSDGLLSEEIFGITKDERSGIHGYINLREKFIQPYYYRIWLKIDKNLRGCVYETQNFKIDKDGYLVPDENGDTGIKFLIKNIDKINFKNTKKDQFLAALQNGKNKGEIFTDKIIVTPPFYRDVDNSSGGKIGVGEVNKLYVTLLNNVRALNESDDYGLDMTGGIRGKIQDCLLEIYNWFISGESVTSGTHEGSGIFKKFGSMRRSVMSKTTDNTVRLVISAPNIDANSKEELMVDLDYSSIPLSAVLVIAYPFIIYYLRQWANNEFGGKTYYNYINTKKEKAMVELDNIEFEFSDDRFDKEINEFIHGYSNRFKTVKVPNKEGLDIDLRFKGYSVTPEEYAAGIRETDVIIDRSITWVDLFYIAACEAVKDKTAIISRYPIDSYQNQLYTKIHVASTLKTEPMIINGVLYKWYPYIRQSDIGKDSSNKFVDTLSMTNPYCIMMGADYDGDQITCKMAYSVEANQELQKYMNSNAQFIFLNGTNGRKADKEALQAMYDLTLVLPDEQSKLTNPQF